MASRVQLTEEDRQRLIAEIDQASSWAREALDAQRATFDALFRAASAHFRAIAGGVIYRRHPAIRVILHDPADGPDVPHARLDIRPAYDRRAQRINPDRIELVYFTLARPGRSEPWVDRLVLVLSKGSPRLMACAYQEAHIIVPRLCRIAARFLDDPRAAVAASGQRCAICYRPLADPESRARGIGPECFDTWGELLDRIERQREGQGMRAAV